jgi:hypothetical protein
MESQMAGSKGSDTGSNTENSEGNSQGKLAMSEAVESEGNMVDTAGDCGGFDSGKFGGVAQYKILNS